MTTLRTTSAADLDIALCAQWFEQQQSNLGNDFLDAVEHARQEIAQHPLACPTLVLGDHTAQGPIEVSDRRSFLAHHVLRGWRGGDRGPRSSTSTASS